MAFRAILYNKGKKEMEKGLRKTAELRLTLGEIKL